MFDSGRSYFLGRSHIRLAPLFFFFFFFFFAGPIPAVGFAGILFPAGQLRPRGFVGHCGGPHLFLPGGRISQQTRRVQTAQDTCFLVSFAGQQ